MAKATPVRRVVGGKVYLLDRHDTGNDKLRCLDFVSGRELWNFAYAAPGNFDHAGSRTTPTVDADNVYTCGPLGDLYCINTNTHKPVWHANIWKDFGGGGLPTWAITQNPLIYRNLLIVLWTYGNWQCGIPVPHAVDAGEGRVLITGGYNAGAAMIKVQKKEDGNYGVTEVFKSAELLTAGENWAPIALVDGKLLIRDQKQLKCVAVGQKVR